MSEKANLEANKIQDPTQYAKTKASESIYLPREMRGIYQAENTKQGVVLKRVDNKSPKK
jgi:hypothetical protein